MVWLYECESLRLKTSCKSRQMFKKFALFFGSFDSKHTRQYVAWSTNANTLHKAQPWILFWSTPVNAWKEAHPQICQMKHTRHTPEYIKQSTLSCKFSNTSNKPYPVTHRMKHTSENVEGSTPTNTSNEAHPRTRRTKHARENIERSTPLNMLTPWCYLPATIDAAVEAAHDTRAATPIHLSLVRICSYYVSLVLLFS
jgi:hypothetical protein